MPHSEIFRYFEVSQIKKLIHEAESHIHSGSLIQQYKNRRKLFPTIDWNKHYSISICKQAATPRYYT